MWKNIRKGVESFFDHEVYKVGERFAFASGTTLGVVLFLLEIRIRSCLPMLWLKKLGFQT